MYYFGVLNRTRSTWMQHVIKRCSAVFFSRGEQTGRHGRRRLLSLLSDRTTCSEGWAVASDETFSLVCVYSGVSFVANRKCHDNSGAEKNNHWIHFTDSFKHCVLSAAVVQSVTVGPRYGTGRFSLKSSVSDRLHFFCFTKNTANFYIFLLTPGDHRSGEWKCFQVSRIRIAGKKEFVAGFDWNVVTQPKREWRRSGHATFENSCLLRLLWTELLLKKLSHLYELYWDGVSYWRN